MSALSPEPALTPRRRHSPWLIARGVFLVVVVTALAWVLWFLFGPLQGPGPGLRQAVAVRLGVDGETLSFLKMAEKSGCVIAEVSTGSDGRSIAARKGPSGWYVTSVSTDAQYFDLDDPEWQRSCGPRP